MVSAAVAEASAVAVQAVAGKSIYDGLKLFNDGAYFEAHDFFENFWQDKQNEFTQLYHGLTNISVGAYHLACRNLDGALSQLNRGLERLEIYPDEILGINLSQFRLDINYLIKQITVFYSEKNYNFDIVKFSFIELNT